MQGDFPEGYSPDFGKVEYRQSRLLLCWCAQFAALDTELDDLMRALDYFDLTTDEDLNEDPKLARQHAYWEKLMDTEWDAAMKQVSREVRFQEDNPDCDAHPRRDDINHASV